jgi:integration host factor subunit alpha
MRVLSKEQRKTLHLLDFLDDFCHPYPSQPEPLSTTNRKAHIMALTKADIVQSVQTELGFTKNQSVEIVESLLERIKSTLESGEDVLISGFGKFCVQQKKRRKGRNPATGEDLILDARKVVGFKCSGKLRKRVNGG